MITRINSPVLVPFGYDRDIISQLIKTGVEIYVAPQYHFWGKYLTLILNSLPTDYTLDYIYKKYHDDFTGIVKRSKYYGLMKLLFNKTTAESIDNLYQLDLDSHQKLVLGLYLSKILEASMDDRGKIKKPLMNKMRLDEDLGQIQHFFTPYYEKSFNVKFLNEELTDQKFATIYDTIYRKSRLYTPQYLGLISLFTGKKEKVLRWNDRLKQVINNNLIQGGNIILHFPSEYEEKINKIMKQNKMEQIGKEIWQKPFDIKITKINKGIKKWKIT